MATLDELVHYCKMKNPVGAFMLTGEWGTGKTHLIEKELAEAVKDTHVIVRVSLYGLASAETLHKAVKEKWISACSPVLGKVIERKDQVNPSSASFYNVFSTLLKGLNPTAGTAADLMVSLNVLDMVTIMPEIEDFRAHKLKRVVLIFDDLERSKMDLMEVMGAINDYCENLHFNTIIVTNEAYLIRSMKEDLLTYSMLKGKTVSRTVCYVPDFEKIIHQILLSRSWGSDEYRKYLKQKAPQIIELFASQNGDTHMSNEGMVKSHNLLVMTSALEDFYRIFVHLKKAGVENPDNCFFSFLAYAIAWKSGIFKEGELCFNCPEEDVQKLYPMYKPEYLSRTVRNWISYGIWDKEKFAAELAEFPER